MVDRLQASFTVEAVFVMTITIYLVLTLCYGAMYMHDKAVISSFCQYQMDMKDFDSKQSIEKQIKKFMFITDICTVSVKSNLIDIHTKVKFAPRIHLPFIHRLLLKGREEELCERIHGRNDPAKMKWDYDLIQKLKKKEKMK